MKYLALAILAAVPMNGQITAEKVNIQDFYPTSSVRLRAMPTARPVDYFRTRNESEENSHLTATTALIEDLGGKFIGRIPQQCYTLGTTDITRQYEILRCAKWQNQAFEEAIIDLAMQKVVNVAKDKAVDFVTKPVLKFFGINDSKMYQTIANSFEGNTGGKRISGIPQLDIHSPLDIYAGSTTGNGFYVTPTIGANRVGIEFRWGKR